MPARWETRGRASRRLVYLIAAAAVLGGQGLLQLWAQDGQPVADEDPEDAEADEEVSEALWEDPDNCQACHVEDGWEIIKEPDQAFDHSTTGFPLFGLHQGVACDDCHRRGLEALTQSCDSCHRDPHAGIYSLECAQCHDELSWDIPRTFAIHERTRFPLTGVHASIQCEACHRRRRGEPAAMTPTECSVCHAADFRRAVPNHMAAGPEFTQCGFCHDTSSWRGADYTHRVWVQDGAHAAVDCVGCHTGTVFAGLSNGGADCLSCHQSEFDATATLGGTVPNHTVAVATFMDCPRCHTAVDPPVTFRGATFVP
jgi:hypothetical protein